jgi:Flp pilus assembly protein TadB
MCVCVCVCLSVCVCVYTHTQTDRHTDRQTDTQTDRQTDTQTDRQTDTQTDTQTDRQTDTQTDRQTHRQTHRQTDRQRGSLILSSTPPTHSSFLLFALCVTKYLYVYILVKVTAIRATHSDTFLRKNFSPVPSRPAYIHPLTLRTHFYRVLLEYAVVIRQH